MTLGTLIETHGYWLLALGCLLEGETVLLLAGFAAHRGYLDPLAVVAVAATAGFLGDQVYFWLGRRHGAWMLARWPSLTPQVARVQRLINRYHEPFIVAVRFAYGLRIAGPVLLGTTAIRALRFAWLNALGALLWACAIGGLGWLFGNAAEAVVAEIRHVEGWLLLVLAALGVLAWGVGRKWRR